MNRKSKIGRFIEHKRKAKWKKKKQILSRPSHNLQNVGKRLNINGYMALESITTEAGFSLGGGPNFFKSIYSVKYYNVFHL